MADQQRREWGKGDPEPEGVEKVGDCLGRTWKLTGRPGPYPWTVNGHAWFNWDQVLLWEPLIEVLPEKAKSARGHRNGCQGCDHDPAAYPTCWTDEQVNEHQTRLREAGWTPSPSRQDAPNPVSLVSGGQGSDETPATDELRGFDWERAQLAAVIFETWKMLGPNATPQNASPTIAADVIRAGWRPPLPLDTHGVGSLSEAIGLALGDAYAGIEFEDPTFERGTDAVIEALREWEQVEQS